MLQKMKWLIFVAAFAVVVSGCSTAEKNPGAEPPAETPAETPTETPAETPAETPTEEPAEPDEEPAAAEVRVRTGAIVEIDTMIEGMTEKVEVTEFTLLDYDIHYLMRTAMGKPTVEDGKVVYKTQMGDEVATITIDVREGVALDDAIGEVAKQFADGYDAQEPTDIPTDVNTYPGKQQGFQKDGYYHGYKVYDIEGDAFVITYSYPFDAGDGMAAVLTEMQKSLEVLR